MAYKLPSTNSLRAFEAVARLSSVRAAATELCLTPAAISKQLKMLEEHLECPLFHRKNQRIALTSAGKKYLRQIKPALEQLHNASLLLQKSRKTAKLKIRSYATFAVYWLIPRLSSFYELHPDIDVEIITTSTWKDIEQDEVDAAIRLGEGKWDELNTYKLIPNVLTPVCSPEVARKLKTPNDLKKVTLLHALARPDDWKLWLDAFGPKSIDPYGGSHYENSIFAYQAAIQGHGVAIAQKGILQLDPTKSDLVFPFTQQLNKGDNTYYLVTLKNKKDSIEFSIFRDWLLQLIKEEGGVGT